MFVEVKGTSVRYILIYIFAWKLGVTRETGFKIEQKILFLSNFRAFLLQWKN